MERLTERINGVNPMILVTEGFANKGLKTIFNGYDEGYSAIDKCAEYEDLEEQGLLLRLPCKVGDTVYTINIEYNYTECEYEETADECVFLTCPNRGRDCHSKKIRLISINEFSVDSLSWLVDMIEYFGKTVFLTREEAEQALEQMKGAENERSN